MTLPPRILEPPRQARLEAEPAAAAPATIEEIVVTGEENPWRLPDLGSAWREAQAEQPETGRIRVDVLPLWDPAAQQPVRDLFPTNNELQRVGFIEVFRVRFGGR